MPKALIDPILVKAIHFAREHLGPSATVMRMQVMTIERVDDVDVPKVGVHWDVGVGGKDEHSWAILGSGPSVRVAINAALERIKR